MDGQNSLDGCIIYFKEAGNMPRPGQPTDAILPYGYYTDKDGHAPQHKTPTFDLAGTQKQERRDEECSSPGRLRDNEFLNRSGDIFGLPDRNQLYDNENP